MATTESRRGALIGNHSGAFPLTVDHDGASTYYSGALGYIASNEAKNIDGSETATSRVGVFQSEFDASLAANADVQVELWVDIPVRLQNSATNALTAVGEAAYVEDNDTVANTTETGPLAGFVMQFFDDGDVLVMITQPAGITG